MHFYTLKDNQVKPRHFVPMVKDPSRSRPSRVSDAKKAAKDGEIWFPSVTTVMNVLDKPALLNWKVDQHLERAFELQQDTVSVWHDVAAYQQEIKRLAEMEMDKAPQAGTDIHQVLEDYLFVDIPSDADITEVEREIIANVEKALLERGIKPEELEKEKYFVDVEHGYAGCADLSSKHWIIDYKSKQTAAKFKPKKMAYPDHYRQLSAYGNALCKFTFSAANIFVCLETAEVDFHQHKQEDLEKGWLDFKDCLSIFNRNTYQPLG